MLQVQFSLVHSEHGSKICVRGRLNVQCMEGRTVPLEHSSCYHHFVLNGNNTPLATIPASSP